MDNNNTTIKISVFVNSNRPGSFYTFKVNPFTSETEFYSVYFPRGYKVPEDEIKVSSNGKKYAVCNAQPRTSSKSGKVYYQVITD